MKALDLLKNKKKWFIENNSLLSMCEDYKAELKDYEEAIKELEEIIAKDAHSSCDGCVHKPNAGENYYEPCGECKRFYADMHTRTEYDEDEE